MPPVDYAALADQARRGTPPPAAAAAPAVDYAALADEARGGHADFSTTNEPPSTALKAAAYGKDALQLALDALPGAGAVIGGALATPETAGAGTLTGAALGAGAGRGLRDLISAGLGLQKPSTAVAEGGKIAMDAGETAVAGVVLPWLWQTIKTPGARVGDVIDGVKMFAKVAPKGVKNWLLPDFDALEKMFPKGLAKAPAAVLERPAWQAWQEHLPDAQPSPQVARSTSTSMIPAAVPAPTASPVPPPSAPPVASPAAPIVTPPPPIVTPPAAAAPPAAAEPIVAASGKMKLTSPEMGEFTRLLKRGLSPAQAYEQLQTMRALAARLGSPTQAQMTADMASRGYKS